MMGILCFRVSYTFQFVPNKMGIVMGILENPSNSIRSKVLHNISKYTYVNIYIYIIYT